MTGNNSEQFRRAFEHWKDINGYTGKELYQHIAKKHGKSGYWVDSRLRDIVETSHEDVEWITEALHSDPNYTEMQKVDQYACYDCEEVYPGLPFYTMIAKTLHEDGAFLCEFCFKGLEKRGLSPDTPGDPRQIME